MATRTSQNKGEDTLYQLYTNNFADESAPPEVVGNWPTDVDLYPDKISDLRGKVVRYATLQYPPYSMVEPFDGMEVRLAKEFCRKCNCTLTCISDDNLWGQIFENGTGNGVVGAVFMDKAELGAGAVYVWENEQKFLTFSTPYLRSRITCLLPRPQRLPDWFTPLLPFTLSMWLAQGFSILVAASVMFAANLAGNRLGLDPTDPRLRQEFDKFSDNLLRSWGMALLQPPTSRIMTGSTLRIFFTLFEALFLYFTTIYSSALSSYLTVPTYYPPINNAVELWRSGLKWSSNHDAWIYSIQGATEQHWVQLLSRFETHPTHELIRLAKTGQYGFPIEIMAAGHVTHQRHLSGEMIMDCHVMKEPLYTEPSVTVMRKGSPYREKFDHLVHRTLDAGLLLLWEGDVAVTRLSSRLQTALKVAESTSHGPDHSEPTILKINHIKGAFALLALGLSVSTLIFFGEKITHARKTKLI